MPSFHAAFDGFINFLWGTHTVVVLLGFGVVFTVWTRFVQWRALTHGVALVRGQYGERDDPGAINHFQALAAALSGTVGLGNIGGVALAIGIGGPGALFWMWMTGFFGMAIKAVEVTLTMIYRDTSDSENPRGGAMWVIERGLGDPNGGRYRPIARVLGIMFASSLLLATFTGGNMFQAWNVADITNQYFGVPQVATGIVMAVLTGMVIIGGIRRIGDVTGRLVPIMCGIYMLGGFAVLVVRAADVPAMLVDVVRHAFTPTESQGAFLGATVWFSLTTGLRRALFSNEAGQGTSPVAHAAAKTCEPVREGLVAALEPFIDTCVVCTLTALVIIATHTWNRESVGDFTGTVAETTDVAALPALPHGERWTVGQGFFVLGSIARSDGAEAGADKTAAVTESTDKPLPCKIMGQIVASDSPAEEAGKIAWTLPANARIESQAVYRDFTASTLTGHAFDRAIPGLGKWLVTLACWLFAVATMISWSYYGEQAAVYMFGTWATTPYRFVYCLLGVVVTLPGFIETDHQLANLADLGSGCMLFTNAPILVLLSYQAIAALRDYFGRLDTGQMRPTHAMPPITGVVEGRDVR
jgi:AGCS family alanine or glycine:cation symporter